MYLIDIPQQPQNLSVLKIQSRFIRLTWDEPHGNNAPILGYYIIYKHPSFAGGEMVVFEVPTEMSEVQGLLPGVTYNFTVIAYNALGNSTKSELFPLKTLEEGINEFIHSLNIQIINFVFAFAQLLLTHHKTFQLCHCHRVPLQWPGTRCRSLIEMVQSSLMRSCMNLETVFIPTPVRLKTQWNCQ